MTKKMRKSQKLRAFRPKLLAASTAVIVGLPAVCSALGLGEIQYKSWLGQPLKAEIDLVNLPADATRENLKVRQVSHAEAERMGVDLISTWHRFDFEVDTSKPNFQIQLQSAQPIKEPYINLLVELAWPSGTLYREYTVFLDPAPVLPQNIAKAEARTEAAPQAVQRDILSGDQQYRVASGDTLYGIAKRVGASTGSEPGLTANWLLNNNPQAFVNGDANQLIAGRSLQLPAGADLARAAPQPAPEQSERTGRVVLDQPLKVEGQTELEMLAAAADGDLQEQLSTTHAVLDYLVKENRDLKDRLSYLESSEYLSTLKQLVDLQKNEIAALRAQVAEITATKALAPESETLLTAAQTTSPAADKEALHASFAAIDNPLIASPLIDSPLRATQEKAQNLWAFLSSGFAMVMAALLAFFFWRSRSRSLGSPNPAASVEKSAEMELPVFTYQDNKKEISLDDYLDINLAVAPQNDAAESPVQASNDQLMHEVPEDSQSPAAEANLSMRDVAEKVQQERNKVEYLQQRIREKTDEYNQRKKDGVEEPKQVEEIEIDPDLEQYLKF